MKWLIALLLVLAPLHAAGAASFTPEQEEAIGRILRQYLEEHPEAILQALEAAEAKAKAEAAENTKRTVATKQRELEADPGSPVIGNPKGDVTLVEFFDYQCGYCKAVHADTRKLIDSDGKLRFVYKEFPILGPASVTAARAALAAHRQGKYAELHNALMENRGQLDDDKIMRIAGSVGGLDLERLKKDMQAPEIQASLEKNLRLAQELNIRGTPAFVIGDQIMPGAIDLERMRMMVAEERNG
jgi:protein-disulfide isomerase